MSPDLDALLRDAAAHGGGVLAVTGAGISAESGVPTFRGPDGYWTTGSSTFAPMEMATRAFFARDPETVWAWYLHRRGVCRAAKPNAAHRACVDLERALGARFHLATQNVDGLHRRAGSTDARTFYVHGDLHAMRCASGCAGLVAVPDSLPALARDTPLPEAARDLLRCDACSGWMRPHVLWFDESYDEAHFRFESALRAAARAALVVVVGTTGATTFPQAAVALALRSGAWLVDVNVEDNPFAAAARRRGTALQGKAVALLPDLASRIATAFGGVRDGADA